MGNIDMPGALGNTNDGTTNSPGTIGDIPNPAVWMCGVIDNPALRCGIIQHP